MADPARSGKPWLLVAASALLAVLLLYVFFGAYLPARQHGARLESELRELYKREAELQTRLAREEARQTARDRQLASLRAERDALAKRLGQLEQELGIKPPRRR
ncbi:MAG: hypothetical protein HY727_12070 [Candidatus Rokubacteria bacterium]|nr:hypothetical protein [Candidatus Rokubacteria bacterium]